MWIAEVAISSGISGQVNYKYLIRGPICKVPLRYRLSCYSNSWSLTPTIQIGRVVENSISFPGDKGISRYHAELHIESSSSKSSIKVMDTGSTFGTFVNGVKLDAKILQSLSHGSIIQIGPSTQIRILFKVLTFCMTRLSKEDKERVKVSISIRSCHFS